MSKDDKAKLAEAARIYQQYDKDTGKKKAEAPSVEPAAVFLTRDNKDNFGFKPKMTTNEYEKALDRVAKTEPLLGADAFLLTIADAAKDLETRVKNDGPRLKDKDKEDTAVAHRIKELRKLIKEAAQDKDILAESGLKGKTISDNDIAMIQEIIIHGSMTQGTKLHEDKLHGKGKHTDRMKEVLARGTSVDEEEEDGPAEVDTDIVGTLPSAGGPTTKGATPGGKKRGVRTAA